MVSTDKCQGRENEEMSITLTSISKLVPPIGTHVYAIDVYSLDPVSPQSLYLLVRHWNLCVSCTHTNSRGDTQFEMAQEQNRNLQMDMYFPITVYVYKVQFFNTIIH